jgi:membrane-bound metal-dependent hydrolase YbcI (DUF457 family)
MGVNDTIAITIYVLIAAFSSLPDIDLKMRPLLKHRKETHNILGSVIFGIMLGILFGYPHNWSMFFAGFISGFIGAVSHLVGDALTYTPIMPFYPFSRRKVALGLFKSSNKLVNSGILLLGVISLIIVAQLIY